jgi:hypothetical protein
MLSEGEAQAEIPRAGEGPDSAKDLGVPRDRPRFWHQVPRLARII